MLANELKANNHMLTQTQFPYTSKTKPLCAIWHLSSKINNASTPYSIPISLPLI